MPESCGMPGVLCGDLYIQPTGNVATNNCGDLYIQPTGHVAITNCGALYIKP